MPQPFVGVLLVALGTPDAPETAAVRDFLREFLSDPYVLDIGAVRRWLLLNLIILPRRPARSAAAYRQVWTEQGSPLRVHGVELTRAVRDELGDGFEVALAMRYGNPSLHAGLRSLERRGVRRVIALPLYPHEAASSTGTTRAKLRELAAAMSTRIELEILPAFHDDPGYRSALAERARPVLDAFRADHVVFSFHGLPQRHIRRTDETGEHCLRSSTCCDRLGDHNRHCYRAQCFATARRLRDALGVPHADATTAFQSRLGVTPWITPYTDVVLRELAARGVRRVAVCCPGFVADCLETLEEIGIRARECFRNAGGEDLRLVPCLNASRAWARAVAHMVRAAG